MKTKSKKAKKAASAVKKAPKVDPAEVLQAVWLSEDHFELENEIVLADGQPVAILDAEGHVWITVKLHVPALDIDCWLDGSHTDHPDNQPDDDEAT